MLVYVHNRKVTMQYSLGSRRTVKMQTLYTNIENTSTLKFYLWHFFLSDKMLDCWYQSWYTASYITTTPTTDVP